MRDVKANLTSSHFPTSSSLLPCNERRRLSVSVAVVIKAVGVINA